MGNDIYLLNSEIGVSFSFLRFSLLYEQSFLKDHYHISFSMAHLYSHKNHRQQRGKFIQHGTDSLDSFGNLFGFLLKIYTFQIIYFVNCTFFTFPLFHIYNHIHITCLMSTFPIVYLSNHILSNEILYQFFTFPRELFHLYT